MKKLIQSAVLFAFFGLIGGIGSAGAARADDLPLASTSALTGVGFDDRPLLLPLQRNFQMAMLTASSELGRSCGKMEAYGWRMDQSEQARVNQIFNTTLDHLRGMGYKATPQTLPSISKDITLLTVDKSDKHFLFLWSAGHMGLVLSLCETTAPVSDVYAAMLAAPPAQPLPLAPPSDVLPARLEAPGPLHVGASGQGTDFSPVGVWEGSYICAQEHTGASLKIGSLRGKDFTGTLEFYPTVKSPSIPEGAYTVYGQYDRASGNVVINPGRWIRHPKGYIYTVMVGSFDPSRNAFSGYFQGVTGCTSFEAMRSAQAVAPPPLKHKKRHPPVKKKKSLPPVPEVQAVPETKTDVQVPAPPPSPPDSKGESGIPVLGGK